ncbi:hypothetical protein ACWC2M_28245, partial [Streptomyces sp. NPDC001761]
GFALTVPSLNVQATNGVDEHEQGMVSGPAPAAAIRPFSQVVRGAFGMPTTRVSRAADGAFGPVRPRRSGSMRTSL